MSDFRMFFAGGCDWRCGERLKLDCSSKLGKVSTNNNTGSSSVLYFDSLTPLAPILSCVYFSLPFPSPCFAFATHLSRLYPFTTPLLLCFDILRVLVAMAGLDWLLLSGCEYWQGCRRYYCRHISLCTYFLEDTLSYLQYVQHYKSNKILFPTRFVYNVKL